MTRRSVSRLFLGAVLALVAGVALSAASLEVGSAAGALVRDASGITAPRVVAGGYVMVGIAVMAGAALLGGALGVTLAWAAALANAMLANSRSWLVALAVLGVASLGILAVVAYGIAGPDPARAGARDAPGPRFRADRPA